MECEELAMSNDRGQNKQECIMTETKMLKIQGPRITIIII